MAATTGKENEIPVDGAALCRYLEWDSNFFGFRFARVEKERISPEEILEIFAWCRQQEIDCLYFLAESSDADNIRLVEDYRFNLVDVRITLDRKVYANVLEFEDTAAFVVRPAGVEDLDVLRQIAGTSIQDTRFYFDPHFPRHLCDSLYRTWIEVSLNGYADTVLVVQAGTEPAGFIACKLGNLKVGQIGLLGVRHGWEGKGIGVALVKAGLKWFASHRVEKVKVVTQGRNIPAQRLYQRCGFLISSTQLWYHRWFDVNK